MIHRYLQKLNDLQKTSLCQVDGTNVLLGNMHVFELCGII